MADCRAEVDAILQWRKSREQPRGLPGRDVSRRLAQLPASCRDDVRSAARDLLAAPSGVNEGHFLAVLEALVLLSDPAVGELAASAIQHPYIMVKEDYVSILEDVDERPRAVDALLTVLHDGMNQSNRPDLTTTIRALHAAQSREALEPIARYVGHPDGAVRGAAIMFLSRFDESGEVGAPAFVRRLPRESDVDLLELLIDGLRGWGVRPDPDTIRRIGEGTALPASLDHSLRAATSLDDD